MRNMFWENEIKLEFKKIWREMGKFGQTHKIVNYD